MVHEEIGFRYVRFHGILTHTHVYRESHGAPVYDFAQIDAIYAAVLRSGMKPFVEISFMPEALASGRKTIFYWKANGSPPTDYGKWAALITAFARNLESRFGRTEVESWRFEVWGPRGCATATPSPGSRALTGASPAWSGTTPHRTRP